MRRHRNNRGLATWVKWLLIVMVVGFVLMLATCGIGGYLMFQTVKEGMDPEHAQKVASEFVTIKQMPEDYKYAFGMDFMGVMTFVAINNEKAKMTYTFVKVPNSEKMTADQLTEQMAKKGVPTAGSSGQSNYTIEVKDKGKVPVAGTEMPYVIGDSENSSTGKKQPAFMGCVTPDPSTAILICAVSEDEGKQITVDDIKGFLGLIEGFKGSAAPVAAPEPAAAPEAK